MKVFATTVLLKLVCATILLTASLLFVQAHSWAQGTLLAGNAILQPGVSASDLAKVKRLAVSFNGLDSTQTRIFEDFVVQELLKAGLQAVQREELERILADQVSKYEKGGEAGGGKSSFLDLAEVGRMAGADAVLSGTLVTSFVQYTKTDNQDPLRNKTVQRVQVFMLSAQCMGTKSGSTLFSVAREYGDGEDFGKASAELVSAFVKIRGSY